MLLDRQVRIPLEEEHVVEDMVGAVDSRIDVAELQRHRLVYVAVITVVVYPRLVVGQAVGRGRERPQRVVGDVDEVHGALGGDFVARDHGRDRVTDEANLVAAERVLVVADRQDPVGNRERIPGQHEMHAVDRCRTSSCRC